MKLAMAQMQMGPTIEDNLTKTLQRMERAAELDADLIFFPEVQLSPFFAAQKGGDASQWLLRADGPEITAIREKARELGICVGHRRGGGGGSPGRRFWKQGSDWQGARVTCQPLPQKCQALETPTHPHPCPSFCAQHNPAQPQLGILASSWPPSGRPRA